MARSTVEVQFGGARPEGPAAGMPARDVQNLTYTLLGEAAGEGVEGMVAVANVIRNRASSGIYSSNPDEVVMQPWQFSTNNDINGISVGGNQLGRNGVRARYPVGSELYQQAEAIARRYILNPNNIDLTGGSLFYHRYDLNWRYADDVVGPYGTHQIGAHVFYPAHPIPQVNIGETELLEGYRMQPPMPLPRSARPRSPATSSGIEQLRMEMAVERVVQARAKAISEIPAAARGVLGVDEVTPSLDGENVRPQMDARYDPARGAFVTAEQFASEYVSGAQYGPPTQALGMGALLGRAFPLATPNPVPVPPPGGARPAGPAAGMPAAKVVGGARPEGPAAGLPAAQPVVGGARPEGPAAGMPVQSSIRLNSMGEEVSETELSTRMVRTIRIDPRTSQPILEEEAAGPSVVEQIKGPVGLTALERVERAQAVKAGSAAANAATSRTPMPLPREARPAAPAPVPLPRDARPAREPLLAEKLNVQPLTPPSSAPKPPASSGTSSSTVRTPSTMPISPNMPKVSTTIRPLTSIGATVKLVPGLGVVPKISNPAPSIQTITKTVTVKQSGGTTTFKPGTAEMPKGARPASVPPPSTATVKKQPVGPATQTTDPAMRNAISAVGTSAPGKGVTAAQKNAMTSLAGTGMSNAIPPVPAARLDRPAATAPEPVKHTTAPTTRTVTVRRVVPAAPPPPAQFRGTATGRLYNVGALYTSGAYVVQAQADGSFKKVAGIGKSSASTYAALNSGPGSVAAMELKHSGGGSSSGTGGGPAAGGEYASGGR